jgi:hypothetical protein
MRWPDAFALVGLALAFALVIFLLLLDAKP